MFAVEGWNLGQIVTQTQQKRKLKRKRGEKDELVSLKDEKPTKESRKNPFSIKDPEESKKLGNPDLSTMLAVELGKKEQAITKPSRPLDKSKVRAQKKAAKKAEKRLRQKLQSCEPTVDTLEIKNVVTMREPPPPPRYEIKSMLTPLQQKMRVKLSGSQFRHINEKLYTTHSSEALTLFANQPSLFHDYHQGFRHQIQSWPTNPIDIFISNLSTKSKSRKLTVADLGCGDAALAQHFQNNKNVKVKSFDLVKVNDFVEVCDMAKVPLKDESIDIAIFCLSLMGTNFLTFIREACRYTKLYGQIWIAEIKSRFIDQTFQEFIQRLAGMGLKLLEMNKEEKMFVLMRFERMAGKDDDTGPNEGMLLKACLYKKR